MNLTGKGWGFRPHCHIKYLPFPSSSLRTFINSMVESYPLNSGEYNHFAELKPTSELGGFPNRVIKIKAPSQDPQPCRAQRDPRTGGAVPGKLFPLFPPCFLHTSSQKPEVSSLSRRTVQTCPSFQGFNHKNTTSALISSSADFIWTAKDWGVTANLWFKIKRVTAQLSFEKQPFLLSGAH